MKVQNTLKIVSRVEVSDVLQKLSMGSKINAKILERLNNNEAILEIAKNRVRAEFQKGLPHSSIITLQLKEVFDNTYKFELFDKQKSNKLFESLADILIKIPHSMDKSFLYDVSKFLMQTNWGIFELNEYLILHYFNKGKNKNEQSLFKMLLQRGFSKNHINLIQLLFMEKTFPKSFYPLLAFLGTYLYKNKDLIQEESINLINNFLKEVDNKTDGLEVIQKLIDLFNQQDQDNFIEVTFPFFKDKDDDQIKLMYNAESCIIRLDLTETGIIDIIIQKLDKVYISLFFEKQEALIESSESLDQLYKQLSNIDVTVSLFNSKQIINKIIEINKYQSVNSMVDLKA